LFNLIVGTTSSFEEESSGSSSTQKSESTIQSDSAKPRDYESNFKKKVSSADFDDAVEVTINRDSRYKDFGISISDNFFGSGILISKIRSGSSADENPYLQPFTQIYKVRNFY
jgi:hypothetical protein